MSLLDVTTDHFALLLACGLNHSTHAGRPCIAAAWWTPAGFEPAIDRQAVLPFGSLLSKPVSLPSETIGPIVGVGTGRYVIQTPALFHRRGAVLLRLSYTDIGLIFWAL